jgi:hypothetical protein
MTPLNEPPRDGLRADQEEKPKMSVMIDSLAAKEKLFREHYRTLPLEEQHKLGVLCGMVKYGDQFYRAHAYDGDYNEIHVTDLSSHSGAMRLLREWAVANGLFYGGGYTRHRSSDEFAKFRARCRAKMAHHWGAHAYAKADDAA